MKKREGGFTLIELLVVVIILGVLAAIAVPQYFKAAEKGKLAEAIAILGGLRTGELAHYAENGNFDSDFSVMIINVDMNNLRNFTAPIGLEPGYSDEKGTFEIKTTRSGTISGRYGAYIVHINETGYIWLSGGNLDATKATELGYNYKGS